MIMKLRALMSYWKALGSMLAATALALACNVSAAYAEDKPLDEIGQGNIVAVQPLNQPEQETPEAAPAVIEGDAPETAVQQAPQSQAVEAQPAPAAQADPEPPTEPATALSVETVSALYMVGEDGSNTQMDMTDGAYAIDENGTYLLTGPEAAPVKISAELVKLILDNVVIDARGKDTSAISLSEGISTTIEVIGANTLIGDESYAGIYVPGSATLDIVGDEDEDCSLAAIGNAGIDYSNTTEAAEHNWTSGCGIGGIGLTGKAVNSSNTPCPYSAAGEITIEGNGHLTLSAVAGGRGASGIGGGYGATGKDIVIRNTTLDNVGGGCRNAEPETSNNKPEYAKQTLEGGPAIGAGTKGAVGGTVSLINCTGRSIVGGGKSAGIGGGCWADDVYVVIRGCDLNVVGGTTGAGIGTGRAQDNKDISVLIADSTIYAVGGYFGAGIGLGINGSNYALELANIQIVNSDVTAYGGAGAAGIGGGVRGYNVNVSITDGSNVKAYAGANYQGKYTEKSNSSSDTVTEDGTIGQAGAAAIGRGAWGSVNFNTGKGDNSEVVKDPKLVISSDSTVTAYANGDNWAIAGFTDMEGVDASMMMLRFSRNYDIGGAEHDTRTPDEAEGVSWEACFLDGETETVLKFRDPESGKTLFEIVLPGVGDTMRNGYDGEGRIGYYTVATTIADPGALYKIATFSDLRTLTRLGDEVISSDAESGYSGTASYFADAEMTAREMVFAAPEHGIAAYDRVAFRDVAEPEPLDPVTPEPEVPVTPDPDGPVVPDVPDTPVVPDVPDTPVVPDVPDTPVVPEAPVVPESPVTPDVPGLPEGSEIGGVLISDVDAPEPPAPPAPPAEGTAAPSAPIFDAAPAAPVADAVDLAAPYIPAPVIDMIDEEITDNDTPLGVFDADEDPECWVHWWILLGIVLSSVYGAGVIARRSRHSRRLNKMDKEIVGTETTDTGEELAPENAPIPA